MAGPSLDLLAVILVKLSPSAATYEKKIRFVIKGLTHSQTHEESYAYMVESHKAP